MYARTFSASSMEAKCLCSIRGGLEGSDREWDLVVSLLQFALPAVLFKVLDQMILTPPVEAARRAIWP